MRFHKIIYLLWLLVVFSLVDSSSIEIKTSRDDIKHKRQVSEDAENPSRIKKQQSMIEKITVPDDDDDKKTLAQQVIDGKYGLIQTELFSSTVKRPGILSYEVNPEVPKDNINNLGGLKPEEIWLAENHLLVLKGGGFSEKEQTGKVVWPPIDNYIAPQRQVKIPPNPKIPPPFPIQLKDGGPIEVIKGKNNTKNYPPYLNGGPFGPPFLFPLSPNSASATNEDERKPNQGNFTQGNGAPPFPYLPPELYPPAIAFLPPPGNLTELDEDDPRIYYPPKYDFVYKKNYSSHVPPGPLVPGIILPPPPSFFAPLENNSRAQRPNENSKLTNSVKKLSKTRLTPVHNIRQKIISPQTNNYKIKFTHASREQEINSPIHIVNNEHKNLLYSSKSNSSNEEWVPIPAPRPFYITDLNRLKAITNNNRGNDPSIKYDGPKNGWDYDNNTAMEVGMKIQDEFVRVNNFKNPERENIKESHPSTERNEKHLKTNSIPQHFTSDKTVNKHKVTAIPQYYTTESIEENYKSSLLPQYFTTEKNEKIQSSTPSQSFTTERNENNIKPSILVQYESAEKIANKFKSNSFPQNVLSNFAINNPSAPTDEVNLERPIKNQNAPIIRGKLLNPVTLSPLHRPREHYFYEKPYDEINTLIPQRVYGDVTIKTPSLNGRIVHPSIKYDDDYRNTVKPTSKPLSVLYYDQESKYQADDGGYSYNIPVNPYRSEEYQVFPLKQDHKINLYTSTTKKPPVYEYSYSAPGYGTLESPKVGNNIETTPKPMIFESNFKPIKNPQFTFFEYQTSGNQNDYKIKHSTPQPTYTTPQPPVSTKNKYVKVNPYQTENPYASYHTHDIGLLDDITKKYFTLFGQKISPDSPREITTSLPKTNENYYDKQFYKNYESIAPVPTKAPSSSIRFPEIYHVQSDRPYFENQQEYTTPKYRVSNRKPKPNPKPNDYSYYYSSNDPVYREYQQEVVRPNHPLHSDIDVNYKIPSPNVEPDAEIINPAYLNPVPLGGNSYISYRLPGNSGHFYFLTPQAIQQQNFPLRNSRIRYQDVEKQGYIQSDLSQK